MTPYFLGLYADKTADDSKSTTSHASLKSKDDRNRMNPLLYQLPRLRKQKQPSSDAMMTNVITLAALTTIAKELKKRNCKAENNSQYKRPHAESISDH